MWHDAAWRPILDLSIPRLASADFPEFATPEARAEFKTRQTRNFGDFDELIGRTQELVPAVERQLAELDGLWQAFAVLLPVHTVGVMGDARSYDKVFALHAVTSTDNMTADSCPFDHAFLSAVATRIISEVRGINPAVYDVTSKPPGKIERE